MCLGQPGQPSFDVRDIIWLDVDMMYGIEFEDSRAHRRSRNVAHRPSDEFADQQRIRAIFRPSAAEKMGADRPRKCPEDRLGKCGIEG